MRVWIVNQREKVLFYEGALNKHIAQEIKAEVKSYFGWKKLAVLREGNDVYLMDGKRIEYARKVLFGEGVVA